MEELRSRKYAFILGVFAGELLISKGAIQPDFQFENIGNRNGVPVLLDSADVIPVKLPIGLTKDVIRTMKESIFSLVDNYEGSFENNSYVRAGFVARTGILGHMVYEDARDNGYSSFLFVEKSLKNIEHSLGRITKWCDVKPVIGEWMEIPLDLLNVSNMKEKLDGKEKRRLSYEINNYYLRNTIHILALTNDSITKDNEKVAGIYADISLNALQYGMPYMAYGFAKKCKAITNDAQINLLCDMVLTQISEYVKEYESFVIKHIDREAIELMWILEDFDITLPKREK